MDDFDVVGFCLDHPGISLTIEVKPISWADESYRLFITMTDIEKMASIRKVVLVDPGFSIESVKRIVKMYIEGCMYPQLAELE